MKKYLLVITAIFTIASHANASVITSLPGGTAINMPADNNFTAGPVSFGPITYSSTNNDPLDPSVFGYTDSYGYGSNGDSGGGIPLAGLNAEVGYMTFEFSGTVSAVLAELGWSIPGSSGSLPITADIFDSSNNLLESLMLSSDGDANDLPLGYYGFQRSSADIKSLRLSNGYITGRNFSVVTGAVPEPSSWLTMIVGFGLIGAAIRRRPKVNAHATR
jgi:hypothetical protein